MSEVDCKWEQVQEIMESQKKQINNDRTKRGLCSIIEELQKNKIQTVGYQNDHSISPTIDDFNSVLCDTTPASESIIDTPSSIPPSKRRRRLDRMNGTTLSSTPSTLNSTTSTSSTDYTTTNNNNNNSSTSNNNNQSHVMKHERLSPGTPDTSSRSLTPSSASHPDTPPAQDMMLGGSPLLARNYSDIMRSLAAKYNNANPNDYFSRNGFPLSQPTQPPPPQSDRYKPHLHPSMPQYPSFPSSHLPPSTSSSNSSTDLNNATPSPKTQSSSKPPHQINSSGPSIQPCRTPTGITAGGDYNSQQQVLLNNPFTAAAAAAAAASGTVLFPPLIDMSSTQALLTLVRTAKEAEVERLMKTVKPRLDSPLDLSSANSNNGNKRQPKIVRTTATPVIPIGLNLPGFPFPAASGTTMPVAVPRPISDTPPPQPKRTESASHREEHQTRQEDITTWSVDDVCRFVAEIDICAEYEQNFREQSIDGSGLPLLTEEHLVKTMRMRLGPALKLRSLLAKKIGSCTVCLHCNHCHSASTHGSSTSGTTASLSEEAVENKLSILGAPHNNNVNVDSNIEFEHKICRRDSNVGIRCKEGVNEEEGVARSSPTSN